MNVEWKIGDKLRILDATKIIGCGRGFRDNGVYEVTDVYDDGTPVIQSEGGSYLTFVPKEMPYVERVTTEDEFADDIASNAELGEPSAECNCEALADIYEELIDIKAMIGRLLRNGGDTE